MPVCKHCKKPMRSGDIQLSGHAICLPCMKPFEKCYYNEKLSICAFFPFYNEIDVLPKLLDSLKDFPLVIACDGKWKHFPDKNAREDGLSYDGSRELIKKYKNTILLDCGNQTEEDMLNMCFAEAGKRGFDLALQMGADEYIEGDLETLLAHAKNVILTERKLIYFIEFYAIHITPPSQQFSQLGRLHFHPEKITVRDVHWWYYVDGVRHGSFGRQVPGITIIHDDTPRKAEREHQMAVYQSWNEVRESKIIG